MSNKIYRIIGNEGRVTIPHQMRLCAGLTSNAVVSFELVSGDAVLVRREQLQDQREFQSEMPSLKVSGVQPNAIWQFYVLQTEMRERITYDG